MMTWRSRLLRAYVRQASMSAPSGRRQCPKVQRGCVSPSTLATPRSKSARFPKRYARRAGNETADRHRDRYGRWQDRGVGDADARAGCDLLEADPGRDRRWDRLRARAKADGIAGRTLPPRAL